MTRLAPLVERTDDSSHQYSCVDRAHEPDDIEAALRRQPAQTCPSARQESPPLPAEDHFLVALDRGLSVFDKPARLARSACGSLPPSSRAVASLFVFIAVKSVVPDVAGVVSLRRGRHRAGHSLRPYLDFRLFAFRQVLHGRALPRPHAMLSGERRWPSRRWVLSTPMHSAPSRCRCSGGRCIEAVDGIPGRRKQSQESRARLRARASFQSFSSGLH